VKTEPYKMTLARAVDDIERVRLLAQMDKILKRLINGVVESVEVEDFLWQRSDGTWAVVTRRLDGVTVAVREATPEERTLPL
jgi:hypothetical protein